MKLTKVIVDSISGLIDSIGKAIDKNVTSDEERLKAKKDLTNIILKYSTDTNNIQKELMLTEMQGNKYQRSWRPSLMYMAMFVILFTWVIMPLVNIWAKDPYINDYIVSLKDATDFWNIILLGVGAFGIGRSAEKITNSVVGNIDVGLNKKKKPRRERR